MGHTRIEFQGNSTYKGDETLKPDEHRDPSGMLPGSLSFLPDVRSLYPFQFLKSLGVFQASTNQIVIPELPALRKLTISYSDSYCNFGCVKVDLSKLPRLSTFGLENMDSQSLLISGEALTLRSVTISWSDFDLLDFHKLGRNIEEIEADFSNLSFPSAQHETKLPKLRRLVLQHSIDFFLHLITIDLPSLEDLLIEGIDDDPDMCEFLPELSNPHDRDSVRLRMGFSALSTELIQLIARQLTEKDTAILARTCQLLYRTLNSILYRYNAKYHASSALLWACEKGILDTVLRFLEYNTNDNTRLSSDWKGRDHPLYVAAKNGYDEIVRTLLQEGVKVDATSNRRRTAISIAASNGHQSVVDELLCAGADYDLADDERKTPLSWAAEHGFVAVVEQLVAAGANINHIDIHGQTPLYLAAWRGRDESVRQLLQAKADTSISADITGLTALSIAAFKGNSAIVKQLIKAGADIHHTNATGNTPLMLAVCIRHIATVRELLHAGAKTTGCSTNRENALAWAAEHGDIDMVRILIEAGADVKSTHPDGRNALSFAAERGHIEICKILVQAGSEVDSVDMLGRTALSWAAEHGSIDQFIYLWQLDPQLGQTDRFGRSPLSWAAEKGHNDIISFVVSQRAPLDITHKGNWDVELISDAIRKLHRSTFKLLPPLRFPWQFRREEFRREDAATLQRPACNPLGIAVAQGHTQAVKTLLDAGAATDIKDITGFTPLMLAAKRGDLHVVSLLVSAGASLDRKCQRGWDAAKIASASGHHSLAFYLNRESGRMRYTSP
ncbi:hypothetical protein KXV74_004358 [Aspergillus fumigatus]|nr:hypothetical protein KXW51_002106 [Aspergillus fumigatus]KAH2166236.1 hypothetical protein KXV74_004358 [Aspergillus fumigatus]